MRRQPIEEEMCSNSKEKHKYNQFLCSFEFTKQLDETI